MLFVTRNRRRRIEMHSVALTNQPKVVIGRQLKAMHKRERSLITLRKISRCRFVRLRGTWLAWNKSKILKMLSWSECTQKDLNKKSVMLHHKEKETYSRNSEMCLSFQ